MKNACITLFYTVFSHRFTTATWNFLISQPLYGVGEHNTKASFSFSKLRYGPFGFNPREFVNIWQIKWNWEIDEVWNSANLLFKWISGLLSSKHFATMVTWRNDFSSLSRRVVNGSLVASKGVQVESLIAGEWLFFVFLFSFLNFRKGQKHYHYPAGGSCCCDLHWNCCVADNCLLCTEKVT